MNEQNQVENPEDGLEEEERFHIEIEISIPRWMVVFWGMIFILLLLVTFH